MSSFGMPWIRLDVNFENHPKTQELCDALNNDDAAIYLVRLWCWMGIYHPTGALPVSVRRVEQAAKWKGQPGVLVATLVRLRFLDETPEGFICHGWEERNGRAFTRLETERNRIRQKRAEKKSGEDVLRNRSATVAEPLRVTGQNRTKNPLSPPPGVTTLSRRGVILKLISKPFESGWVLPTPK